MLTQFQHTGLLVSHFLHRLSSLAMRRSSNTSWHNQFVFQRQFLRVIGLNVCSILKSGRIYWQPKTRKLDLLLWTLCEEALLFNLSIIVVNIIMFTFIFTLIIMALAVRAWLYLRVILMKFVVASTSSSVVRLGAWLLQGRYIDIGCLRSHEIWHRSYSSRHSCHRHNGDRLKNFSLIVHEDCKWGRTKRNPLYTVPTIGVPNMVKKPNYVFTY